MNAKFFDLKQEKQDRIINAALKIFAKNFSYLGQKILKISLVFPEKILQIQSMISSVRDKWSLTK